MYGGGSKANMTDSIAGKICMVTGATAGIGLATARGLASRGATLIVVGRNRDRCGKVADTIGRETGNPAVDFLCADLSSQSEIRELAKTFNRRFDRLHVLVNNAGAMFALRRKSVDGIEMTLALNHLGPFLLTTLLVDALKTAAPARIVNVSSSAHEDVEQFDFDDPQMVSPGRWLASYPESELASLFYSLAMPWAHPGFVQYARTKFANVLFTTELARRLEGTGVTANALHPGLVASSFPEGNGAYGWFMRRYMHLRGISAEAGAATSIYLATANEISELTGRYYVDMRVAPCAVAAQDPAAAARLWQLSEQLTRDRTVQETSFQR